MRGPCASYWTSAGRARLPSCVGAYRGGGAVEAGESEEDAGCVGDEAGQV